MPEHLVITVGAGPSGLAAAGCLSHLSIPHTVLEREDCSASLWRKYTYDRLHLHLRKHVCELPHMPFPSDFPNYVPKNQFVQYMDDYASHFKIAPLFQRSVESASFDEVSKKWKVIARHGGSGEIEEHLGRFLVVASGETANPHVPKVEGLETFPGDVLHSTQYKNGKGFENKNVLVVGSGNSGMEIALDLANYGAKTSILIRSPVHILTREIMYWTGMLFKYLSFNTVDSLAVLLSKLVFGDLSKYGIRRPTEGGPFYMKVLPEGIECIKGNEVVLRNGKSYQFDAIVFCTGFKRSTNLWLKDDCLLNEDGFAKQSYPNHWKGKNGLYCVGLSGRGLYGAKVDAINVANDIKSLL
ncbi:hypothetical protein FEM48_Zijuj09G0030400 [Ziziphus jujuba var. spinosa]|uniref:Flavin-containing monooxygenase n=1 Tax=Ziziphus jujuba var. spinosa TaxID=714518 RepID=A0A978UQI7_ZIZJJ|nr:hypothetical protein FEM48_Zijuj09G0030400 [Ziziphus jujuba var. spinosa]